MCVCVCIYIGKTGNKSDRMKIYSGLKHRFNLSNNFPM